MKVTVSEHNLIVLLPESDADAVLLKLWSNNKHKLRIASSALKNSKVTELSIKFEPIEHKEED